MRALLGWLLLLVSLHATPVSIDKGWNLVGFHENMNASTLQSIMETYQMPVIWHFHENQWEILTTLDTLNDYPAIEMVSKEEGVWILSLNSATVTLEQNSSQAQSDYHLNTGWQLLSPAQGQSMNASIFSQSDILWRYNNGVWEIYSGTFDVSTLGFNSFSTIEADQAFWVKHNTEETITIDATFDHTVTTTWALLSQKNQLRAYVPTIIPNDSNQFEEGFFALEVVDTNDQLLERLDIQTLSYTTIAIDIDNQGFMEFDMSGAESFGTLRVVYSP
jgi:hypothetical protein